MEQTNKFDADELAVSIVKGEVTTYRDPVVFITEKVAFQIKEVIRQVRKNYWGVFDEPTDKITGRKKIWVPLTQMIVDNTRKNVDLDTKDINFFSNLNSGLRITQLLRAFVRAYLDRTYYGEDMDDVTFSVCVDPVSIMKIYKTKDGIKRRVIDPLNIFVDPSAKDVQRAYRFTHMDLMTTDEVKAMTGWKNTNRAVADTTPDTHGVTQLPKTSKYVDVYETWGLVPKSLFTGNSEDTDEVEAQLVVSGINRNEPVVHLIKENKNKDTEGNVVKPFEDARYMKVPWSFYGISPAMKVMDIQEWVNTIVNLRNNKNTIAQLGLFKIRAGSNINTQALTRLVSNGVIKVTNMDDLDNFQIPEAGPGSYRDEETAKMWAAEVTSAYEVVRGQLPSTATATAAVIQDKNSKSAFVIVTDSLGRFNEKVIQRHILPHLPDMMKKQGIIRYFSDMEEAKVLRERVVANEAMKYLDESVVVPSEMELSTAMNEAERRLQKNGDLFFSNLKDIIVDGIETRVQVTNEKMDTATVARNLQELLQVIPQEAQPETAAMIYDVLGLTPPKALTSPVSQVPAENMQVPNQTGEAVAANTLQNVGTV